jgi:predicted DNA-binding transcriptional regulator
MMTDCRTNQLMDFDLLSFLKDISCTDMQFKLLSYWGRHPKTKLSLYTIARALDTSAVELRDAIKDLVEKGILRTQHSNDGLTTYALCATQIQEYIDELGSLDRNQAINLRRQLKEEL